jgi:hypothetical protein
VYITFEQHLYEYGMLFMRMGMNSVALIKLVVWILKSLKNVNGAYLINE